MHKRTAMTCITMRVTNDHPKKSKEEKLQGRKNELGVTCLVYDVFPPPPFFFDCPSRGLKTNFHAMPLNISLSL